jgi:rhamnose utilization protein RhaD (predicted bifunctional aldolase and dehydrogenase)/NAD(P)-dependent dehydrogenase (short-subunit alcohol dehydrogenase family)
MVEGWLTKRQPTAHGDFDMKNQFNNKEVKTFIDKNPSIPRDLAMRVYTSRLLGREKELVLHGGGNTSVKLKIKNIFGDGQEVIFVKGSGMDLASIDPDGFVGLDLEHIRKLRSLDSITDEELENQLRKHKLDARAPDPSVETLLHSFLPHKYVDHTHADSILALTNQKNGLDLIKKALGPDVAVIPYLMSGLALAEQAALEYETNPRAKAIVVLNHGIFTFGEDASTSYTRMIDFVSRAEQYIEKKLPKGFLKSERISAQVQADAETTARLVQTLRGVCARHDGSGRLRRIYTEIRNSPSIVEASLSQNAKELCRTGVLTPDHVIWTKNRFVHIDKIPSDDGELKQTVKSAVLEYERDYDRYVADQGGKRDLDSAGIDRAPRVFLVAGIGIVTVGITRKAALTAADIAERNLEVKRIARAIGEYEPISEKHVFDMEYWSLEQKKTARNASSPLAGKVALVTGAAGAIGFGVSDCLMAAGAVAVVSDIDEPGLEKTRSILAKRYGENQIESIAFDVSNYEAAKDAIEKISSKLGGIDILVPNAGIAHVAKIEDLDPEKFNQIVSVNLMGTFNVIKACIPVFRRQGTGGAVVVVSSKNVFDPGVAFGAYSASKAAAHQISKIAAMELAELGVRVNMINPDAVFGDDEVPSKLWKLIGPDRMKSRGLDAEGLKDYYRQRNLLKISVQAKHVGNIVVFFADDDNPITGATLPIDGGIPAAFPR